VNEYNSFIEEKSSKKLKKSSNFSAPNIGWTHTVNLISLVSSTIIIEDGLHIFSDFKGRQESHAVTFRSFDSQRERKKKRRRREMHRS